MKSAELKSVKKGEFLRLKNSETSPVYIRGGFCRESKKYSLTSFDDVNREILKKSSFIVYVDFTF